MEIPGNDLPVIEKVNSVDRYCRMSDIKSHENQDVNICVIVYDVEKIQMYNKNGIIRKKQKVLVVDDSLKLVALYLWNLNTSSLDELVGHCVIGEGLRVDRYRDII